MPGDQYSKEHTFTSDDFVVPEHHNDNLDGIEDFLNPRLSGGDPGDLIICDVSGNPRPVALSGEATIDENGVLSLAPGAGDVGPDAFTDALASQLGISQTGEVRRGKSIIAAEESRTNTAYGTLTTPDRVQNVVLPTDGLIVVAYQALFKASVASAGRAAIFVGSDQLKAAHSLTAAAAAQEVFSETHTGYSHLASAGSGLVGAGPTGSSNAATPQAVGIWGGSSDEYHGGPCHIVAPAGTYTISVQFKSTSGSVTAKERKLWVWTMGF